MDRKLKMLVVDDSPLVAPRVISMLDSLDPAVVVGESASAEEAAILLQEVLPDVILLDINLPGKNGVVFLAEVKSKYPNIKVIVFTNHAEPYYREICKDLGADYFFDKSSEFDNLPKTLQNLSETQMALA